MSNDSPERSKQAGKSKANSVVKLDNTAARLLDAQAEKLGISKMDYASAAIAYFATNGLDPTQEQISLSERVASVGRKVGEGVANVRGHNADIGNRLFALVRGFEKNLYDFLQQQQLSNSIHLELIESNILRHQVSVERELLVPMIERLVKANADALFGRISSEHLYVEVMEVRKKPTKGWEALTEQNISDLNKYVENELREFKKNHPVPVPEPTDKPAIIPVPPKSVVAPSTAPLPMAQS
ncbi:MAG: hypothetical protein EOO61_13155 [Hymenobacter sp.]|nr:MAG: hypothetical protein EOO61_13155 [Hymenobacter sp.]